MDAPNENPPPPPAQDPIAAAADPPKKNNKIRTWQEMYECLVQFKAEHNGSVAVPRIHKPDKNLGEWVVKQRMYQRKLTAEQRQKLLDLGFSFESRLEGYERKWQEMFAALLNYKDQFGHCNVTEAQGKEKEGLAKLARWVHYQRKHHNKGNLAKERVQKLTEIGFVWNRHSAKRKKQDTAKIDVKWEGWYAKLEDFYKENGHTKILQDHHDQPLYFWFKTQRTLFHQGLLREDRKQRLDVLGMVWDTKETLLKNWEFHFERLLEYKQEKGTVNCAHRYERHGLGNWIAYQKRTFREGTIEPDRAKRLLDVDMAYIAEKDYSWDDRFAKVKLIESWQALEKDPELERWVRLQLVLLDSNKQSRDRRLLIDTAGITRLAAMPGGPRYKPKPRYVPPGPVPVPVPVVPPLAQPATTPAAPAAAPETTTIATSQVRVAPPVGQAPPDVTAAAATNVAAVTIAGAVPKPAATDVAWLGTENVNNSLEQQPAADTTTTDDANTAGTINAPPPASPAASTTADPMIVDETEGESTVFEPTTESPPAKRDKTTTTTAAHGQAVPAVTEPVAFPKPAPEANLKPAPTGNQAPSAPAVAATSTVPAAIAATAGTDGHATAATATDPAAKPKRKRGRPRIHPIKLPTRRKKRTWDESFQSLCDYKEEFGTVKLPSSYPPDNALLKWAKKQRTYKHSLSEEQISRLEGIGFCFDGHLEIREKKWENKFADLVSYIQQHGNALVTPTQNKDLSVWVSNQRKKYKLGTVRKDRLDRLNAVNFCWNAVPPGQQEVRAATYNKNNQRNPVQWQAQYDLLCKFHRTHGHCDVKAKEDQKLWNWIKKQRVLQHTKNLPAERKEKLDKLGFIWRHKEHNDELIWNSKFDLLVQFKEKEGHCVPTRKNDDRYGLASWCGTQRAVFKTGDMFPERARKLLELGFPIILEAESSWKGRYDKLKELTTLDETWREPPFERWIELQKVLVETDSLPSDRKQLILAIGIIWENEQENENSNNMDQENATPEQDDAGNSNETGDAAGVTAAGDNNSNVGSVAGDGQA